MSNNELLLAPIAAWMLAQIIKSIIYAIENRRFEISRLIGDGGMPSGHSATVTALATASALCYGLSSFQFAFAAVFAVVVMHDASGIRLESGKQAKVINDMLEYLQTWSYKNQEEKLKELLGHTPLQVLAGALIGLAVAMLFHFVLMK